jgi:hypothetical protein
MNLVKLSTEQLVVDIKDDYELSISTVPNQESTTSLESNTIQEEVPISPLLDDGEVESQMSMKMQEQSWQSKKKMEV